MREVYIRDNIDFVEVGIVLEDNLEQYYKLDKNLLTGGIYLGKVMTVKKDVGIFIDIGEEKNAIARYREGRKAGDTVVVQVSKEPRGDKGCAVTERITLAGRYCVLNDVGEIKFSRNIGEEKKIDLSSLPHEENIGYIFRTAAEDADIQSVYEEMEFLYKKYQKIISDARNLYTVTKLYSENALEIAKRFAPDEKAINYDFSSITDKIANIYARKIEIKGAQIVFDHTEAMTVVDINSYKFCAQAKDVDTANFFINKLAVEEIARQLRLRNIGGIIAIDYISMTDKDKVTALYEHLVQCLSADNVKVTAEIVAKAGIFVLVRKQRYAVN